ncbi:MAG: hypothetical protein AAFQ43_02715 [Bacteroidota bacterium]
MGAYVTVKIGFGLWRGSAWASRARVDTVRPLAPEAHGHSMLV